MAGPGLRDIPGSPIGRVIQACAEAVRIPVVGNGDIATGEDVRRRLKETSVAGLMIGRAAVGYPWVFRDANHFLETGNALPRVDDEARWALMLKHCRMAVAEAPYGTERTTTQSMRSV